MVNKASCKSDNQSQGKTPDLGSRSP